MSVSELMAQHMGRKALLHFSVFFILVVSSVERDLSFYGWDEYNSEYQRYYSPAEAHTRRQIFEMNLELIKGMSSFAQSVLTLLMWTQVHNADPSKSWYAAVNEFTDWTEEEFRYRRASGLAEGFEWTIGISGAGLSLLLYYPLPHLSSPCNRVTLQP